MRPVLEVPAVARGESAPVEGSPVVGADSGKNRHVMGTNQNADGIELQQPGSRDGRGDSRPGGQRGRPPRRESLSRKRNPPRFGAAENDRIGWVADHGPLMPDASHSPPAWTCAASRRYGRCGDQPRAAAIWSTPVELPQSLWIRVDAFTSVETARAGAPRIMIPSSRSRANARSRARCRWSMPPGSAKNGRMQSPKGPNMRLAATDRAAASRSTWGMLRMATSIRSERMGVHGRSGFPKPPIRMIATSSLSVFHCAGTVRICFETASKSQAS